jgi:hypothetical protein
VLCSVGDVSAAFSRLSAFAAGIATGVFVGRIDSPFVQLPNPIYFVLMGYSCIQLGWAYDDAFGLFTIYALGSKILLFLVISWLFSTGLIAWYLQGGATLGKGANRNQSLFLYKRVGSHS